MKHLIFVAIAIICALSTTARVLDPAAIHHIDHFKRNAHTRSKAPQQQLYMPMVMRLAPGSTITDLEAEGIKVIRQRQDLVLAFVPTSSLDHLQTSSGIKRASLGYAKHPLMDKAREFGNVTKLLEPSVEFPQGLDGNGVVVGLVDTGFDPHHPNFLGPDGRTRVKRLVNYCDTIAEITRADTPELIDQWITDNPDEWHATHVAGTLTGSCEATPYRGVASGAEIVCCTSLLTDACILDGVEEIIDYAKQVNKPAVINLSLGSYLGPHDGTTLFNQYLDLLGEEAIIVMSAGNAGGSPVSFTAEFTPDRLDYSIIARDVDKFTSEYTFGSLDFWSDDDTPFTVTPYIYDLVTYAPACYLSPAPGGQETKIYLSNLIDGDDTEPEPFMSDYWDGYIKLTSEVDPDNNRYHTYITIDVHSLEMTGLSGRYLPAFKIEAPAGVTVRGYADGTRVDFINGSLKVYAKGSPDMSISDIGCGKNVIVVGAASSRNEIPQLSGETLRFNFNERAIAKFSSYGTLADGRKLPHISAPGNYVVSSISTPFVEAYPEVIPYLSAKAEVNGRQAWWIGECGTSMSSPFVAGTFALWKQINPNITVEQARAIAIATARRPEIDPDNPRWGYGNFDAFEGARQVMISTGAEMLPGAPAQRPLVNLDGRTLKITSATPGYFVTLTGVDGKSVLVHSESSNSTDLSLHHLPKGIYLISVSSHTCPSPYTSKIALK